MTVVFDEAQRRLRLDADTFTALAGLAGATGVGRATEVAAHGADEPADPAAAVAELTRAGAVHGDQPHDSLSPGLAAVTQPLATLDLIVSGGRGVRVHQGWLSVVSAILADVGDGTYDFVTVGTEFVPTTVARLTRLGLRPRLAEASMPVDAAILDALSSLDDAVRLEAIRSIAAGAGPDWPALAAQIDSGEWRFWVADVTWPSGQRRLAVLDTQAGLLTLGGEADAMLIVPTTPTEVWRQLASILPGDADLTPHS